jgi:hypothetical protein
MEYLADGRSGQMPGAEVAEWKAAGRSQHKMDTQLLLESGDRLGQAPAQLAFGGRTGDRPCVNAAR